MAQTEHKVSSNLPAVSGRATAQWAKGQDFHAEGDWIRQIIWLRIRQVPETAMRKKQCITPEVYNVHLLKNQTRIFKPFGISGRNTCRLVISAQQKHLFYTFQAFSGEILKTICLESALCNHTGFTSEKTCLELLPKSTAYTLIPVTFQLKHKQYFPHRLQPKSLKLSKGSNIWVDRI